jgi:hypothetical protein
LGRLAGGVWSVFGGLRIRGRWQAVVNAVMNLWVLVP